MCIRDFVLTVQIPHPIKGQNVLVTFPLQTAYIAERNSFTILKTLRPYIQQLPRYWDKNTITTTTTKRLLIVKRLTMEVFKVYYCYTTIYTLPHIILLCPFPAPSLSTTTQLPLLCSFTFTYDATQPIKRSPSSTISTILIFHHHRSSPPFITRQS